MKQDEEGFFDFLLGYRKTVAWFCLFAIAVIFRLKGYVDGGQFVDLSKATFLGFIGGNSVEHLGNIARTYIASKVPISGIAPAKEEG